MAQRQYVKYNDPLLSFLQNVSFYGMFNPGRYRGFDTISVTAPNTVNFLHTGTGLNYVDANNEPVGPLGISLSKQGVLIVEDQNLTGFVLASNLSNNFIRVDALVMNHSYVTTPGDNPATYEIITGPFSSASTSPTPPILPDPDHQVVLGLIVIQPLSDGSAGTIEYIPQNSPDTGDQADAKIKIPNTFNAMQQWRVSPTLMMLPTRAGGHWEFPTDGNIFNVVPNDPSDGQPLQMNSIKLKNIPQQNGTRIKLRLNPNVIMVSQALDPSPSIYEYQTGYRPIQIPGRWSNGQVSDGPTLYKNTLRTQEVPGLSEILTVELEMMNNSWQVIYTEYERINIVPGANKPEVESHIPGLGYAAYRRPLDPGTSTGGPIASGSYNSANAFNFVSLGGGFPLQVANFPALLDPSFTRIRGGVKFCQDVSAGSAPQFLVTRKGIVQVNAAMMIGLDYGELGLNNNPGSPNYWGNATLGYLYLAVYVGKAGPPETYDLNNYKMLDYKQPNDTNPIWMAADVNPRFTKNLIFQGSTIVEVEPGDLISMWLMRKELAPPGESITYPRPLTYWNSQSDQSNSLTCAYLGEYFKIRGTNGPIV